MYKRQIYRIAESNRIESKLFCPNWNALLSIYVSDVNCRKSLRICVTRSAHPRCPRGGAERRFAPGRPHGDIFFPQVASRRIAARRRGGRPGPRRPPADNFRHRPSSLPLTTNTPDRFSRAPLHAGDFPTGEQLNECRHTYPMSSKR